MMKFSKLSHTLAAMALLAASVGVVSAIGGSLSPAMVSAAEEETPSSETAVSVPDNETEVDSSDLHISITSSTTTDKSHSIGARFASSIDTYQNRPQEANLYFTIDDASYDSSASPEYDDDGKTLIGPVYTASLYAMYGTKASWGDVVIPSTLKLDQNFIMNVTSIFSGCAPDNVDATNRSKAYQNVTSIIIPKHITTIYENAFTEVPDTVTIKCEAAERPEGWDENWTDAKNIEWGYVLSTSTEKGNKSDEYRLSQAAGSSRSFSGSNTYIVGSYLEGEYYKPLLATYSILNADGSVASENNIAVLPLTSTNLSYDFVGGAQTSLSISFDIEKEVGQTIDVGSIVFHNIYLQASSTAEDGSKTYYPDLTTAYYGVPTIGYSDELKITDLISFRTSMVSTYTGYLDFNLSVDKVPDVYPTLMPSSYEENEPSIASGDYTIRYLFSSLNQASYRITYKSGGETITKTVGISTPVDFLILSEDTGNYAGFSLKMSDISDDFSFESVVSVELIGLYIRLDIYNNDTAKTVNKSSFSRRFGVIDIYSADIGTSYTNIETMVVTWICIYIAVFIVGAIVYYVYAKNRFKNDEFRRMDNKKYLIAAAKNLAGFGIITLAILYNIARWCIMNTSVVAFNPLDAYLIVFTVAGAIFLGFFIKGVVVAIKNTVKRKKDARLKLDQDVAEDGTN